MFRLLIAAAVLAMATIGCAGDQVDDRPLELNYLTTQIFAPSCGVAQCHSTFKREATLVFDTPEGTRASLVNDALIRTDPAKFDPDNAADADLIHWITDIDPLNAGIGRMPYDAPIPNRDVKLLIEYIADGAPGAQCNPADSGGKACTVDAAGREISVDCTADWNFDKSTAVPCTGSCVDGVCQ